MTGAIDQLPPHSTEAEAGVLGCILLAPQLLPDLVRKIPAPEAFYVLKNRAVFVAMADMHKDAVPVDAITLSGRLTDTGQMVAAGGVSHVSALPDKTPSAENFKAYLQIVREKYAVRRTIQTASELSEAVLSSNGNIAAVLAAATPALDYCRELLLEPAKAAPPRSWIDIVVTENDDSVLIGPGRWLTRGSGCFLVAPTGAGKSTWTATQAFSWALGRQSLGFVPTRPLKSLIIQAEDDDGDLFHMASGIASALKLTQTEAEQVRANVLVETERAQTGLEFLTRYVAPRLSAVRPDLLWINPVSAYFGNDLCDQQAVAAFFRNALNPMLAEFRCSCFPVHHCAKPSKERKDWNASELAYFGSGSSDLANWSRETIVLRATAPGLYEMICTKRWRKLGWRDADGKATQTRQIAHGTNGAMFWRDATPEVLEELGAVPYSDSRLLAMVPSAGIDSAELVKQAADMFHISKRTAASYVNDARRLRRHNVNGTTARYALLANETRRRRDVYPDSPRGPAVVWLTAAENRVDATS